MLGKTTVNEDIREKMTLGIVCLCLVVHRVTTRFTGFTSARPCAELHSVDCVADAGVRFQCPSVVPVCRNRREATAGGVSAGGPGTSVPNVLLDRSAGTDPIRAASAATAG